MQTILLLGGIGGLIALLLSKKGPGKTVAAEVPEKEVPADLRTRAQVEKRFDEVKTLYRMGRLSPTEALIQMSPLVTATNVLKNSDIITDKVSVEMLARFNRFVKDVAVMV